jgi:hypothetical protein
LRLEFYYEGDRDDDELDDDDEGEWADYDDESDLEDE